MAKDNDVLLTIAEIRSYFEVSNHMVNTWINDCGMPVHQVGGVAMFKKHEVDEWIRAGGADRLNNSKPENQ